MKSFIEMTEYDSYNEVFVRKDSISCITQDEETSACIVHFEHGKTLAVCEDVNYILHKLGEVTWKQM